MKVETNYDYVKIKDNIGFRDILEEITGHQADTKNRVSPGFKLILELETDGFVKKKGFVVELIATKEAATYNVPTTTTTIRTTTGNVIQC